MEHSPICRSFPGKPMDFLWHFSAAQAWTITSTPILDGLGGRFSDGIILYYVYMYVCYIILHIYRYIHVRVFWLFWCVTIRISLNHLFDDDGDNHDTCVFVVVFATAARSQLGVFVFFTWSHVWFTWSHIPSGGGEAFNVLLSCYALHVFFAWLYIPPASFMLRCTGTCLYMTLYQSDLTCYAVYTCLLCKKCKSR